MISMSLFGELDERTRKTERNFALLYAGFCGVFLLSLVDIPDLFLCFNLLGTCYLSLTQFR